MTQCILFVANRPFSCRESFSRWITWDEVTGARSFWLRWPVFVRRIMIRASLTGLPILTKDRSSTSCARCIAHRAQYLIRTMLEAWVDWFAFQCQDSEDALVDAAQGLIVNKAFQSFEAQSKFARSQGAFSSDFADSQAF